MVAPGFKSVAVRTGRLYDALNAPVTCESGESTSKEPVSLGHGGRQQKQEGARPATLCPMPKRACPWHRRHGNPRRRHGPSRIRPVGEQTHALQRRMPSAVRVQRKQRGRGKAASTHSVAIRRLAQPLAVFRVNRSPRTEGCGTERLKYQ